MSTMCCTRGLSRLINLVEQTDVLSGVRNLLGVRVAVHLLDYTLSHYAIRLLRGRLDSVTASF